MKKESLVPLTGVLFIVLLIASFAIGGEPPEASDDVGEIVDHYVDNKDAIIGGSFVSVAAALSLIFFAGYLRKILSSAEDGGGMLPGIVLVGASIIAVGAAIDATILVSLAEAAEDIDPVAVQALQALWDNDFVPLALGAVTFLLSAGIAVVRSGALPVWLGWVAIALAVVGMTPVGFLGVIGGALWILVVSVMLSVRARSAAAA